jgi:hypothetical protein
VLAQGRRRRDAEDEVEAIGSTPIENLGTTIMAIAAQQNFGLGPVGAKRPQQSTQKGFDLLAANSLQLGRLAGRSTAVMKRPPPSKTTIG